jgi:hypothetical protein
MNGPSVPRGRDLLTCYYSDLPGVLDLRAISLDKRLSPIREFCAPNDFKVINAFVHQHKDRELYYGQSLRRDATSGELANCTILPMLFADLDFHMFADGEPEARAALARCPLPPTTVLGSGGGLHIGWRLKEPLDLQIEADQAKQWLRRLAHYLGADLKSAEPTHVLRLPNTFNHKYDPPRLVTLECLEPTREYCLSDFDFLPDVPAEERKGPAAPVTDIIPEHERNSTLTSLAGTMRRRGMTPEAIKAALLTENALRCRPPLPEAEVANIARSIGRYRPQKDAPPARGGEIAPNGHRTVTLIPASGVTVRPVRWVWDQRLALGTFNLLGGREGVGKSTCGYQLAADLTRGRLKGVYAGQPRAVIVAATEDSREHTIVPRLMAAGADLSKVFFVDVVTAEGTGTTLCLPRDLEQLERLSREVGAALLLLDPLMSRLDASLDTHKDSEVRQALEPLVALADTTDACVLGLIHVNKASTSDPLTMLMGSRAFVAVARAVLFVMKDPHDEEKRLLGQPKNNLGRCDVPTLTFQIAGTRVAETPEGEVWTGRLAWLGESDQTIQEAINSASEQAGEKGATTEASDWLFDYLTSQGGVAESRVVKKEAEKAGHSSTALRRARERLHLGSDSYGFPRMTLWKLPKRKTDVQSCAPPGETQHNNTTSTTTANEGDPVVPVVLSGRRVAPDDTTGAVPAWVTEDCEPDLSDPIGAHDEDALRDAG